MSVLTLVSLLPILFFLPVIILNYLVSKLFNLLNLKISRSSIYRADAFASNLGYKDDLISSLEVLDSSTTTNYNSLVARIMATRPSTMSRIGALEDEKLTHELAQPFVAANVSNLGGNSEVLRICAILGIIGVLWYFAYALLN